MKKFLSILLALAVGFTFTFGSAMSAFGATYSLEDYTNALQAEKTAQIGYMNSAKAQAIGAIDFDNKSGFDANKYSKAAYEAAADAVIARLTTEMDSAIRTYLDVQSFPMGTAADLSTVRNVTVPAGGTNATTATGMKTLIDAEKNTAGDFVLNAAQAPLTKKFVEDKLAAVDLSKYNSTDKDYQIGSVNVTAAEKVQSLIDGVKNAIATEEADTSKTAADKVNDYYALYFGGTLTGTSSPITGFKADLANVNTLEDEAAANAEEAKTVEAAAKAFVAYGVSNAYPVKAVVKGTELYNLTTEVSGDYAKFYEAALGSKKATVFGVEVGNIAKVTKAELTAINDALYKAIIASEDVLKNSGLDNTAINALYGASVTKSAYLGTIDNTMNVAEKYSDVEKYATSLKGAYNQGIKLYEDAKVDAALATAKKLVYADVKAATLKAADEYLARAIAENEGEAYVSVSKSLGLIMIANFDADKFDDAKDTAIKKMYKSGTTPQTKVLYGENKTPEADFVYLQGTYYITDADTLAAWNKIATKAVKAIRAAQSYADIDAALEAAKADFSKLMLAVDGAEVVAERAKYCTALDNYKITAQGLVDTTTKYDPATFTAAAQAGKEVINKANTVADVKAAYEKAKAIVDATKSKAELAAAKEEIEAKINALPATAALTATDLATVKAVVDAYAEYTAIPGYTAITTTANVLKVKYEKVISLTEGEIALASKDLKKKMDAVSTWSDADVAAYVALKAEAEAIKAKGKALLDEIEAVNEDEVFGASVTVTGGTTLDNGNAVVDTDFEAIATALDVTNTSGFWAKECNLVETMLVKAGQANATEAEMKAALEAFNKLTDAQKYVLTAGALSTVKVIENRLAEANKLTEAEAKAHVQDLSIAVRTAKVGKKVKVTVNADVQKLVDNGFTVEYKFYKSTKKGSGYKNTVNKTTNTYTNTNPVKGKNYYKVKLVVKNADGTVVATTPLTQCKYGVRTIK